MCNLVHNRPTAFLVTRPVLGSSLDAIRTPLKCAYRRCARANGPKMHLPGGVPPKQHGSPGVKSESIGVQRLTTPLTPPRTDVAEIQDEWLDLTRDGDGEYLPSSSEGAPSLFFWEENGKTKLHRTPTDTSVGARSAAGRRLARELAQLRGRATRAAESLVLKLRSALMGAVQLGTRTLGSGWTPLGVFDWQVVTGENGMDDEEADRTRSLQRVSRQRAVLEELRSGTVSATGKVLGIFTGAADKVAVAIRSGAERHTRAVKAMPAFQFPAQEENRRRILGARQNASSSRKEQTRKGSANIEYPSLTSGVRPKSTAKSKLASIPVISNLTRKKGSEVAGEMAGDVASRKPTRLPSSSSDESAILRNTTVRGLLRGVQTVNDQRTRLNFNWKAGALFASLGIGVAVMGGVPAAIGASAVAAAAAAASTVKSHYPIQLHGLRRSRVVQQIDQALLAQARRDAIKPARSPGQGIPVLPAAHFEQGTSSGVRIMDMSISGLADETIDVVDADSYAMLPSEPAVFSIPVFGTALTILDNLAYSVENLAGRLIRRLNSAGWLLWVPYGLGSTKWQVLRTLFHRVPDEER